MKKNRFTEFFKGKGYYMLLFVGVVAIAAVAIIGSQLSSSQDQGDNLVDINDVNDNIAADEGDKELAENSPISEGIVNNEGNSPEGTAANDNSANTTAEGDAASNQGTSQDVASNEDMIEYEGYSEDSVENTDLAGATENTESALAEDESTETSTATAQNEVTETMDNLSFSADDGLMWPVSGNVIMNYSMEHTIYYATLMQYKCNPAIIIDAEVGTEVKAAAAGVVSSIDTDNEETGITVTMEIGNGFSLVYGQLSNLALEVGDLVQEGEVIGTVNEPTKYYALEGSNLYFMVLDDDQTVNPMLLLR